MVNCSFLYYRGSYMNELFERANGRKPDELRVIKLEPRILKNAEGSCFAHFGHTKVLCSASVDSRPTKWRRDTGKGWITAEYGMLPRSTNSRMDRESVKGKQSGRTSEIQRLIGRSLRAIVNMELMGEIQIRIDCDVIQADGVTRTTAITGAYVALYDAFLHCKSIGLITEMPFLDSVAAVSCGVINNKVFLDLDYNEDSSAEVDANFILTGKGKIVEVQATAESDPFSEITFSELMHLAKKGIKILSNIQKNAINES